MVRVTMTDNTNIICQRFAQNAWKRDLCSNCFKSKEDHDLRVHAPSPYRHQPILNFPQQGILKESNGKRTGNQTESKDKLQIRVVSFRTTEMEIIGFGGDDDNQYSSSEDDDDDGGDGDGEDEYCSVLKNGSSSGGSENNFTYNYPSIGIGTDNEDELEFRKLTRSNTDFNSITANLTTSADQDSSSPLTTTAAVRKPYVDLKLGKPLVDGQGCRRTLHVTVEPFKNCARFTSPKTIVAKTGLDSSKMDATDDTDNVKIDLSKKLIVTQNSDSNATDTHRCSSSPTSKSSDEDNIVVAAEDKRLKISTLSANSTIIVQPSVSLLSSVNDDSCQSSSRTNDTDGHRQECEARIDALLRPVGSASKDSNPICLPLIACKALEIEFDQPGSRELVGEPDGKADSDDSYELLHSPLSSLDDRTNTTSSIAAVDNEDEQLTGLKTTIVAGVVVTDTTAATTTTTTTTTIATTATISNSGAATKISPQRSFLHNFGIVNKDVESNSKGDTASLSSSSADSLSPTRQSTIAPISSITVPPMTPCTPKLSAAHCVTGGGSGLGGSSTKRPAPKPPSPKTGTPLSAFAFAQNRRHNRSRIAAETDYCESPLMSGTRDAISFLTGTTRAATEAKRRTSLYEYFDTPISRPTSSNRNSMNFCSLATDTSTAGRLCTLRRYSTAFNDSRCFDADTERRWPSYSTTDTASICNGTVRIRKYDSPAKKCARSLSYDSIPTPSAAAFALSPKTATVANKYNVATIKVKSTLRRFLRFSINNTGSTRITNNGTDGQRRSSRSDLTTIANVFSSSSSSSTTSMKAEPRKRPVIIHPLDLNKSSVQIVTKGGTAAAINESRSSNEKTEHKTVNKTKNSSAASSNNSTGVIYATPIIRPTKPPPPPRTQSLDHCKYSSYVGGGGNGDDGIAVSENGTGGTPKPIRPPPPKTTNIVTTSSTCENIVESRQQGTAPTKPQRASSMRDRTRQSTTTPIMSKKHENFNCAVTLPEYEHEQNATLRQSRLNCGSHETESDTCYSSIASSWKDSNTETSSSVARASLEDNYGAVVIANHEALSQLLERVNEAVTVADSLKILQNSSTNICFDDLIVRKTDKITVADWTFFNASWNSHKVVVSVSQKHSAPLRSLSADITLCPIIKFTDSIPYRLLDDDEDDKNLTNEKHAIKAHIIVWNEEEIDSISRYCTRKNTGAIDSNVLPSNVDTANEYGLVLTQLTNALKYLQACGIEDVSLDEIFVCKRNSTELKLLLLPFNVDYLCSRRNIGATMSLCKCISTVVDMLLPEQKISHIIKRILCDERATSLTRTKSVVEYWLWGPPSSSSSSSNVSMAGDRQTHLQRWLDLERATYLHKLVCKQSHELTLLEKCRLTFLVRTNAKIMSEASYLLEEEAIYE